VSGEFERIDGFLRAFREAGGVSSGPEVPLGPGDDAALVSVSGPLAVTTDAVIEDVHFRRAWATPGQIGHKALAVNLSDLAAMGARPVAFTCALGLPGDVDDAFLHELARGMGRVASRHGAVLAGGNFSRARELSVTITALGRGGGLRRDGARVGDRLFVAGTLGEAAAELAGLVAGRLPARGAGTLHEPVPQVEAGLVAARLARCGIDVSDGLAQDAGHVAAASGVRVLIDFARVPRSARFEALTAGMDAATRAGFVVAGGEDYALVVAAEAFAAGPLGEAGFVEIGWIERGSGVEVRGLPPGTRLAGHDHFG
jgi:thiamine-monophosphate kinase